MTFPEPEYLADGHRPRRRIPRPVLVGGVAVLVVAGGVGVAAAAASPSPSPSASSSPGSAAPEGPRGFFGHRDGGPGLGHRLFGFGPFGGALHGEFVAAKPGGGYQTIDVQGGNVTAVSTDAITVKSADGFTKSYTVVSTTLVDAQRSGIGSVKVGDQVEVTATVAGGSTTATNILDIAQLRAHFKQFEMPAPPSGTPGTGASGAVFSD